MLITSTTKDLFMTDAQLAAVTAASQILAKAELLLYGAKPDLTLRVPGVQVPGNLAQLVQRNGPVEQPA